MRRPAAHSKDASAYLFSGRDAPPTPINYHFMGGFYKSLCDQTIEGRIYPKAMMLVDEYLARYMFCAEGITW